MTLFVQTGYLPLRQAQGSQEQLDGTSMESRFHPIALENLELVSEEAIVLTCLSENGQRSLFSPPKRWESLTS